MKTLIDQYWKKTPKLFADAYFKISPTSFFLSSRFSKIAPLLKNMQGKKALDVGCGNGVFMKPILEQGGEVVGVDYSSEMLEQAKIYLREFPEKKYVLKKGDATKLSFAKNSFHLVLASGLTDYISKKGNRAFLQKTAEILKKNGIAIITFPKSESPFALLRSGFGLKLRKLFLHLPPLLSAYSQEEIKEEFQSVGLNIKKWDSVFGTMWIVVAQKP